MSNKTQDIPELVNTRDAAKILGRSAATLKRWRYEGVGPNFITMEGRVSYDVDVLLDYIKKNTRIASVAGALENIA
jgi:predicted site-specific integrase-resolvase